MSQFCSLYLPANFRFHKLRILNSFDWKNTGMISYGTFAVRRIKVIRYRIYILESRI